MKCDKCERENLTAKELAVHNKYFHDRAANGQQAQVISSEACPDCGGQLAMQEGCEHCLSCGYSKCG